MLLYMAARAQMVEEVIRPALAAGKTVVCDRYLLANVVYQGYAGGLDVATLWEVGRVATGGLMPDLTIVLDMPRGGRRRATGPRVGPHGAAGRRVPRPGAPRFSRRGRPAARRDRRDRRRAARSTRCRRRFEPSCSSPGKRNAESGKPRLALDSNRQSVRQSPIPNPQPPIPHVLARH